MPALASYVPIVRWLPQYQRRWLRADIVAGLSAGAVVIPQAMAYATVAGMPVQIGLYTCLVPMVVYVGLGGSRTLSFSTTSTIATLSASTLVAAGVAAGSAHPERDLSTLVFLVGAILLLARVARLASLVENISDALLTGLKVGVGLTVALGQLPKLLGFPAKSGEPGFFANLAYVIGHLSHANLATVLLGCGTIGVLLLLKRLVPAFPAPLVAVVGGIVLMAAADLSRYGVARIAHVPRGLPAPMLPPFDHVGGLLPGAIAIALMAFLETVSVARSMRRASDPPIDNGQELLADGVATLAGAFFQAMPAAGGFSQSAVSRGAGARTQLSQFTTVLLAVAAALFLAPVLSELPQATLAAMVIVATLGLISVRELVALGRFDRMELVVALGTAAVSLVSGLLVAVAVGVGLTIILVLHGLNKVPMAELGERADGQLVPGGAPIDGLLILRLGVPLYTANARTAGDHIVAVVVAAAAADRRIEVVVLEATSVGVLSMTILSSLRETERELSEHGAELWVSALPDRSLAMARQTPRWSAWATAGRLWPTSADAVRAYRSRRASQVSSIADDPGQVGPDKTGSAEPGHEQEPR